MSNKHLFIVCMNNSGSTMLHFYLSKCKNIASLPKTNLADGASVEGQWHASRHMPSPKKHKVLGIWTEKSHVFSNEKQYNWKMIKKIWRNKWSKDGRLNLNNMILLEKSPPNVIRANMLQKNFEDSYFILMVRNPYAVIEGMQRRLGYSVERCSTHWGESMKSQVKNLKKLNKVIYIKYEDLCDNRSFVKERIVSFLPELSDLRFDEKFSGHHSMFGRKAMGIKNLNSNQIKNLSKNDISRINNVLFKYKKELNYFGYKMIRR